MKHGLVFWNSETASCRRTSFPGLRKSILLAAFFAVQTVFGQIYIGGDRGSYEERTISYSVGSSEVYVGYYGTGILNLTETGEVSAYNVWVGSKVGAYGHAVVSGTVEALIHLYVGGAGTGSLTLNNGVVSVAQVSHIGNSNAGHGTATVNSGTWSTGGLYVGHYGTGFFTLNGGLVVGNTGSLGTMTTRTGTVTVTGGTLSMQNVLMLGERQRDTVH